MLQSQGFLSQLNIATNDCFTQADMDAKLAAVLLCYGYLQRTSPYVTLNPPGRDPAQIYNSATSLAYWVAMATMDVAVRAGAVETAHADCDALNLMDSDMPVVSCGVTDINICCNAPGWNGTVARAIEDGTITVFNDMTAAGVIIANGIATNPTPPPAPPQQPAMYMWLAGSWGIPLGTPVTLPDGSQWTYSAMMFGPPPANTTFMLVRNPPAGGVVITLNPAAQSNARKAKVS